MPHRYRAPAFEIGAGFASAAKTGAVAEAENVSVHNAQQTSKEHRRHVTWLTIAEREGNMAWVVAQSDETVVE